MWKQFNNLAYRVFFAFRNRRARSRNRSWPARVPRPSPAEPRPVLYLAWGRIGDVVLGTGHLKHLRRWFHPSPVWFMGRPGVKQIVEPYVDAFLPFPEPDEPARGAGRTPAVTPARPPNPGHPTTPIQSPTPAFRYVITDIHTFDGGLFALDALLASLRADRMFVYKGYHLGKDLAPERPYPAGFEVVPEYESRRHRDGHTDGDHLLNHSAHYIRHVLERCGVEPDGGATWRPDLGHIGSGTKECRRFDLTPGEYVAWQPKSANPRKDYPLSNWAETFRAFPDQQFVALVEPGGAAALDRSALPGVRVIETGLTGAMKLIREARLFVGLDSGLSHIATVLGIPTVCVCPDSHLGYFFPYPDDYGYTNLRTVAHRDYLWCRGCFMTCRHEPLTSTISRGALCLRTLPARQVIDAIRSAL